MENFKRCFKSATLLPYLCKTNADSWQFYYYFCHLWKKVSRRLPRVYGDVNGVCRAFLSVRRACQRETHSFERVRQELPDSEGQVR